MLLQQEPSLQPIKETVDDLKSMKRPQLISVLESLGICVQQKKNNKEQNDHEDSGSCQASNQLNNHTHNHTGSFQNRTHTEKSMSQCLIFIVTLILL